jgi:hypothetical protein
VPIAVDMVQRTRNEKIGVSTPRIQQMPPPNSASAASACSAPGECQGASRCQACLTPRTSLTPRSLPDACPVEGF